MQSYVIHFIRHGLTEGNLQGRYIGRTVYRLHRLAGHNEEQRRAGGYGAQAYFCAPAAALPGNIGGFCTRRHGSPWSTGSANAILARGREGPPRKLPGLTLILWSG